MNRVERFWRRARRRFFRCLGVRRIDSKLLMDEVGPHIAEGFISGLSTGRSTGLAGLFDDLVSGGPTDWF